MKHGVFTFMLAFCTVFLLFFLLLSLTYHQCTETRSLQNILALRVYLMFLELLFFTTN